MPEPGPILAAGQAAIEAALATVPAGASGALVVVASPERQKIAVVTRIPGTERWDIGAALSRAAGKVEAEVFLRGSW